MDVKRTWLPVVAIALLGAVGSTANACDPAPQDQVTASFQRLLEHAPSRSTPPVAADTPADPLRTAVSTVLWNAQPSPLHVPASYARAKVRPEPGR